MIRVRPLDATFLTDIVCDRCGAASHGHLGGLNFALENVEVLERRVASQHGWEIDDTGRALCRPCSEERR